jgi:hypothetical protein
VNTVKRQKQASNEKLLVTPSPTELKLLLQYESLIQQHS